MLIIIFNQLMGLYKLFSIFLFLVDGISCKNKTASKQPDLLFKQEAQAQQQNGLNIHSMIKKVAESSVETDQQDDDITYESSRKSSKADPIQPDQAPPSFSLKETSIKAGTTQSIMLEATGNTEGYGIKSISIRKNSTYYTNAFITTKHHEELDKKPIPPAGLSITLTTNPTQQAGFYELKLKIGKTGKGSKPTEQWVKCMVHVINDKVKNDKQNESSSTEQTTETLNNKEMVQNDCPSKDEADVSKNITEDQPQNHTTPAPPSFSLKDITIKAGTTQSIALEVTGITAEYVIKTISLKKNNHYYTKKLGLNDLKEKAIGSSGITFPLPEQFSLKPGAYVLTITIAKNEKNSKKQRVECTVTIT